MNNQNIRSEALQILERIENDAAHSTRLLFKTTEAKEYSKKDLGLLHRLVKGTLEWQAFLDAALNKLVKNGIESLEPPLKNILRLGSYQILFLDRVPDHAAVNESVNLAKKFSNIGASKLVNGVLRNLIRNKKQILSDLCGSSAPEGIAIEFSHPLWIVKRWIEQFGIEETQKLCGYNNQPESINVRINSSLAGTTELKRVFEEDGLEIGGARYTENCLKIVRLPREKSIQELQSFKDGLFIIQDEASCLAVLALAPQKGETVLDLCSAPGGKATHIAELVGEAGKVIAVENRANRLKLVKANFERLKLNNVELVEADGRNLKLEKQVDRILLDAPCSGLGVLGKRSDARWNKSEEDIAGLVELQKELITNAATLLKSGGVLAYSTCTIEADENHRVIEWFLDNNSGFNPAPLPDSIPEELRVNESAYLTLPQRHQIAGGYLYLLQKG